VYTADYYSAEKKNENFVICRKRDATRDHSLKHNKQTRLRKTNIMFPFLYVIKILKRPESKTGTIREEEQD
jgi:hypothetical protein